MTKSTLVSPNQRWNKLTRRARREGVKGLARWGAEWLYWNGRLYRAVTPTTLEQWRLALKYNSPFKKYGIHAPIIVYQMGKVASTSVYNSLRALDLDVPVYHLHFLNDLEAHEEELARLYRPEHGGRQMIRIARELRAQMQDAPRQKWNLISLVRLPIPRAISGYFMKLEHYFPAFQERLARGELTIREIANYFAEEYRDRMPDFWFEQQVQALFGIDVYASEFPKARGFQIYEQKNIRLLVIRAEDLNRCAVEAMRAFLGLASFQVMNKNLAEEKKYAGAYQDFQRVLRMPPEYVRQMHDTQYAQHFYTQEELNASVQRWT